LVKNPTGDSCTVQVSRTLGLCLQELSRGGLLTPLRMSVYGLRKNPPPLGGGSVKLNKLLGVYHQP